MTLNRRTFSLGAAACGSLALAPAAYAAGADDMTIGAPGARVHLVEYASATCPHCAAFHEENWTTLKTRYIDSGRVRFTMREMLTAPAQVSFAMFQLARCGGAAPDEYFRRLAILFAQQSAILGTGTMAGVRDALVGLGGQWGLSADQVTAAMQDQAGGERVNRSIQEASTRGINSTPSFLLNDAPVTDHSFGHDGMTRILDAALA